MNKKAKKLATSKSHFWDCCPLQKQYLPTEACPEAKPLKINDKIVKSPPCDWWIDSVKHNYCFWKFIRGRSNPDGSMKELVQSDLAKLFGWSSAKTHIQIKEAMEELQVVLRDHSLITEIDNLDDSQELITINDFESAGSNFDI